jgi:hypothetical protein
MVNEPRQKNAGDELHLLYVTDLHGRREAFERVFCLAREHDVDAVVVGGDNMDWDFSDFDNTFAVQEAFLNGFLDAHFGRYDTAGIHWIGIVSSHDLEPFDEAFNRICARHPNVHHISRGAFDLHGYRFIGMDSVVDYPFSPKSRCLREDEDFEPLPVRPPVVEAGKTGWIEIADWNKRIRELPTLAESLAALPALENPERTIYVIHHPPVGLGLDVVKMGGKVGSSAVRRFLETRQPLLSLHGHIHESPAMTGIWKAELGRTVCVQPGQEGRLTYVLISLPALKIERRTE